MAVQQNLIEGFLEKNPKHKDQYRRIIRNVSVADQDFMKLTSQEMSDVLVNRLKLDKFNTLNIYLSVLSSLFEYGVAQEYLETNIFEEAYLSRTVLCREISRNIVIIREDILEAALEGRHNRVFIEAANRLFYDGAGANWADLSVMRWSDISTFFWTVDGVRVSEKTIGLLKRLREVSEWYYQHDDRWVGLTRPTDNHLFGFVNKVIYDDSEEVIMRKLTRFIKDNCILYDQGYKLDPQKIYCSGVTNRILDKYGKDFFIKNFTESIRDLYYVNEVIREFGLKASARNLRKMLMPYGMKIKYGM